ncbi:hypothetical protein [Cumulibacter manganitolerans]|uniref:hypothetical protein n=1 Tax=Cumulibacter manganitolerans TaxID=1884992 RepID=UPI0012973FF5|nr:hypothetical protein [Cumulibacter manganitolerans]
MLAATSSAVQPGVYTLIVLAVLLGIAVWMARRERSRRDRIGATLPSNAWTATCLDPTTSATKRLLVVSDEGLAIAETRTGSRDSWPWSEVGAVVEKQLRVRVQTYPGIRISFTDGHVRELLVYNGAGKQAYRDGATEARARIAQHLPREAGA